MQLQPAPAAEEVWALAPPYVSIQPLPYSLLTLRVLSPPQFFDLSFLQYGRGQRTHSLETTKYTTSIPTHVRDPAARVVPTRSGETVR